MKSEEAFRIVGEPRPGGIVVVCDHASNRVPDDLDLGIPADLLEQHIAIDFGVAGTARRMAEQPAVCAFLANVSRLVCDFNRDEDSPTLAPPVSDGHAVPGNVLDPAGREQRLSRYHRPYHGALAAMLDQAPPALIVSLHSFTPALSSSPEVMRPWHAGVLYNVDDRAARLALPLLEAEGLKVGDQEPYSGRTLNHTMNRHAEAHGRPYLGIEVRQDQILEPAGQAVWAERLGRVANEVALAFR
jgi:predicted N-formylglutamate amidohydrolase